MKNFTGLGKLTKIQDENLITEPEFDNRADVMLVAFFLLETKNKSIALQQSREQSI
jgi:hypothetical protein